MWKWWFPLKGKRQFCIKVVDGYIVEAKELGEQIGLLTTLVLGHWKAEY